MLKLAANLSMLFGENPPLERFSWRPEPVLMPLRCGSLTNIP